MWTDLRPGHRAWPQLPPAAGGAASPQVLLEALGAPQAELRWQGGLGGVRQSLKLMLPPASTVLLVDPSANRGPGGWLHGLRDAMGARYLRLTPLSALHDLKQYLATPAKVQVLVAPHADAATAEMLNVEELFFLAKRLCPGILTVADVSHSFGLLPYYHAAWQADITVFSRAQLGHFVVAAPGVLPAAQVAPPRMALAPYVSHMNAVGLSAVWNAVLHEAKGFRAGLAALGATFTAQQPSAAFTAFVLPGATPEATIQRLQARHRCRLGAAVGLSRQPHCVVQHAPTGTTGLAFLLDLLRAT